MHYDLVVLASDHRVLRRSLGVRRSEVASVMNDPDDPRMRFRVWIEAKLVDERWIDTSNPDADRVMETIKARQAAIVDQACQAGKRWLVEVYDPAKPEEVAYSRMGDDADGMVDPRRIQ